jgi:hypothetical protein
MRDVSRRVGHAFEQIADSLSVRPLTFAERADTNQPLAAVAEKNARRLSGPFPPLRNSARNIAAPSQLQYFYWP